MQEATTQDAARARSVLAEATGVFAKALEGLARVSTLALVAVACFLTAPEASAQMQVELAKQYFEQGEYEQAAELFGELYAAQPRSEYYLTQWIESLSRAERYDEAERAIKRALKSDPHKMGLYVQRGLIDEARGDLEAAERVYAEAVDELPAERFAVVKLAQGFNRAGKYALAAEAYARGNELLGEPLFALELGHLYQRLGKEEEMVASYLQALSLGRAKLPSIQNVLSRYLDAEGYRRLQGQILRRLQGAPDDDALTELLVWTYVQQKDYRSAMRQVRALDLRRDEDGRRIYELAETAVRERQYEAAIDGFEYIVAEKGPRNPYFVDAKRRALAAEREWLLSRPAYDREAFRALDGKYAGFLAEYGVNSATAPLVHELARIRAYRLGERERAIGDLDALLAQALPPEFAAEVKLDLADFYLMSGDRWEATLLYSQVDKAFPEAQLGHEARFRNARLSYYASDFEWAQEQFDILKSSTSRLIANDAIDMAVFIMDNLNLDTTSVPLSMYASAELLGFQSRFAEAEARLDSITQRYPEHGLHDDVAYARAGLYRARGEFAEAATWYRRVVEEYPEEIRADNALFALAELTERQLGQPEQAKALYERLFLEYESSILAVEARKRFRRLRGDEVG